MTPHPFFLGKFTINIPLFLFFLYFRLDIAELRLKIVLWVYVYDGYDRPSTLR